MLCFWFTKCFWTRILIFNNSLNEYKALRFLICCNYSFVYTTLILLLELKFICFHYPKRSTEWSLNVRLINRFIFLVDRRPVKDKCRQTVTIFFLEFRSRNLSFLLLALARITTSKRLCQQSLFTVHALSRINFKVIRIVFGWKTNRAGLA